MLTQLKAEVLAAHMGPILSNPTLSSPPGSFVLGILQATILECVAIPSPGGLPDPGTEPMLPVLQADSLPSEPPLSFKCTPT